MRHYRSQCLARLQRPFYIPEEPLWVVVAINVDFRQSIVGSRLHAALVDSGFQPWQEQLETISFLHLVHKLID